MPTKGTIGEEPTIREPANVKELAPRMIEMGFTSREITDAIGELAKTPAGGGAVEINKEITENITAELVGETAGSIKNNFFKLGGSAYFSGKYQVDVRDVLVVVEELEQVSTNL